MGEGEKEEEELKRGVLILEREEEGESGELEREELEREERGGREEREILLKLVDF